MTKDPGFECLDRCSASIDATQWGATLQCRVPTKLGFKSARNLEAIEATNKYPGAAGRTKAMTGSLVFDSATGNAIRSLILVAPNLSEKRARHGGTLPICGRMSAEWRIFARQRSKRLAPSLRRSRELFGK